MGQPGFWRIGITCAALLSCGQHAFAQVPAAASAAGAALDAPQMYNWLARIHDAARQRNFIGTLVVSSAGQAVSSARIAHFCEGGNQYERVESLDGAARHMFRANELVHTFWPRSHVALVEQRAAVSSFPALLQGGDDRIAEFYELRLAGLDRVAGHDASVLTLSPRDARRYGYRLWAEKGSGLLLRADVLGERGELLETSAFSDVTIGVKPQPESVTLPMKRLDGFRILRSVMVPAKLEAEGWTLRETVPGFRQVSCVKRPLDPNLATDAGAAAPQALQAIYSDGLTYVSVFIEPQRDDRPVREAQSVHGATRMLRSRRGDHWITVVGDVPQATLSAFANGFERKK